MRPMQRLKRTKLEVDHLDGRCRPRWSTCPQASPIRHDIMKTDFNLSNLECLDQIAQCPSSRYLGMRSKNLRSWWFDRRIWLWSTITRNIRRCLIIPPAPWSLDRYPAGIIIAIFIPVKDAHWICQNPDVKQLCWFLMILIWNSYNHGFGGFGNFWCYGMFLENWTSKYYKVTFGGYNIFLINIIKIWYSPNVWLGISLGGKNIGLYTIVRLFPTHYIYPSIVVSLLYQDLLWSFVSIYSSIPQPRLTAVEWSRFTKTSQSRVQALTQKPGCCRKLFVEPLWFVIAKVTSPGSTTLHTYQEGQVSQPREPHRLQPW